MITPLTQPKDAKPSKSKILVVDEDPVIRQILLRLLEDENYFVLTAANGFEALELASVIKIDLVLLDLNLPDKDGWETFEQLSKMNPLLPFILMTARPNQISPALASRVGALLEKPLDFVKLFDTMRTLLLEPVDVRMARMAGQPTAISPIPLEAYPNDQRKYQA